MQCAGNRRTAMSKGRAVKGVGWDISAIGNAIWGGAKLADVLELVGIPKLTKTSPLGGKHVEFVSVDMCKEEKGGPYKASIPLIQSTNSEADVLLAYEMNGESAICSLEDDNTVQHGKFHNMICFADNMILIIVFIIVMMQVKVHGYAVSGGGRGIERLDVSFDGGKAWVEASRHQKSGIPYNAIADDDIYCDKWAWVLFEAEGDVLHNTEIVAKAALVPGYMVTKLREFPKERWLDMWRQLKNVSHHFEFQYAPKKEDAVNMLWRQVKHKVPAAKLAVRRSRRLKVPDWWRQRR
ncbi:hypothetical protein HYC85_021018 [Camellia sinensis]|uniref:Oxidoreductase molybdopterin-binding domain-containing protein n=1 Tax=Camellia sinensis TaxID=4442 RepID=A0A7J7GIT4_CAMSI|nr:hypothetical protein HYC85_021018 [Camellia sinensis]